MTAADGEKDTFAADRVDPVVRLAGPLERKRVTDGNPRGTQLVRDAGGRSTAW